MNRMTWIAAALAAGFAVVVAVAWFTPSEDSSTEAPAGTAANGGGGAAVKVDDALAAQGEETAAAQGCTACHSIDGSDGAGPTWSGLYGAETELEGGETVTADDAYLETATLDPGAQVVAGFGANMPSYEGKVSEEDIAGLIEYIKSLGG